MHEVSLVRNIFRTLEDEFSPEELARLNEIELKIGELSNVQPLLMQSAFDAVVEAENRFTGVKLTIHFMPIKIQCEICGDITTVKNYVFKCSNGHPTRNIIQGEELLIEKVHFEDEVPQDPILNHV